MYLNECVPVSLAASWPDGVAILSSPLAVLQVLRHQPAQVPRPSVTRARVVVPHPQMEKISQRLCGRHDVGHHAARVQRLTNTDGMTHGYCL